VSTNGTLESLYSLVGTHAVLLPLPFGQKKPVNGEWQTTTFERTQDPDYQKELNAAINRGGNIGVLLTSGLATIDIDNDRDAEEFLRLNPKLTGTLRTRGARGFNLWIHPTGDYPARTLFLKKIDGTDWGEWRGKGQTVIRGQHPEGNQYQRLIERPAIEIGFSEIDWPADVVLRWKKQEEKKPANCYDSGHDMNKRISAYLAGIPGAVSGQGGHRQTFKAAVALVNGWGLRASEALSYLQAYNQKCEPPWTEKELKHKLDDAEKGPHEKPRGHLRGAETKDKGAVSYLQESDSNLPTIMHPINDRYISDFAKDLAVILKAHQFYRFHGVVHQVRQVTVRARNGKEHQVKKLVEIQATLFSTIIETYCRPMIRIKSKELFLTRKSISLEIAKRVLVCLDFVDGLPEIKLWTDARLPVRSGDKIVLTKTGYDHSTGIYTSPDAPEIDEMTVETAIEEWRGLMKEFCFPKSGITEKEQPDEKLREPERERCIAVALAAALSPMCLYLMPEKAKRPGFAATANSEGAGKTLLLSFGMVAKLGFVPTGSAPSDEKEMRKVLDSAAHYAVPILFFDNLKGHLSSGELEAFMTSSIRQYRQLCTTNYSEAENVSTVYITANFATYSPDLRRRLLAVELFLEEARAEERSITSFLNEDKLIEIRPRLISILWAFIKSWHNNKETKASRLLPSFEEWSNVVAGIVEDAGFSSPCQLVALKSGGDTDTQDMESLVAKMKPLTEFKFKELMELAADHHLFQRLVPTEGDMDKEQSARMGKIIRKFVRRVFNIHEEDEKGEKSIEHYRFCLSEGTRKTERFYVIDLNTG
jgi:hypothetical protein